MNIFVVIILALLAIVVLLRLKKPIGLAILTGGLIIWLFTNPSPKLLLEGAILTLKQPSTYDLLFALYFVMCLEIILRRSGTLQGMVNALNRLFSSKKIILSVMPAFLGLLPSMGGARFSAPIVQSCAEGTRVSAEEKAGINFWFRHIFEFSSPMVPGLILACAISNIPVGDFILNLLWVSLIAIFVGWLFFVRPLNISDEENHRSMEKPGETLSLKENIINVFMALFPILLNVFLMTAVGLHASVAMGISIVCTQLILMTSHRSIAWKTVIIEAMDWKLLFNVASIMYFTQLLQVTGALPSIVDFFAHSSLPIPVGIAISAFIVGVLTGASQGHVSIIFPIVASLAPGDLMLASIAMTFGVAGQMVTPTHVCFVICVDYFKSDFFKTLKPAAYATGVLLVIYSLVMYLVH